MSFIPGTGPDNGGGGEGGGGQAGNQSSGEGGGSAGGQVKTFTQDEVNRITGQRVAEERGKYTDYDKYKSDSEELAKIRDGEKSELQKAQDELAGERSKREQAEKDRDDAKLEKLRSDRAADKEGFPRSLAKKLTGTTVEEIDAEIDEIMTDLNIGDKRPDGSGGASRSGGGDAKPSTVAAGSELYAKLHPKTS